MTARSRRTGVSAVLAHRLGDGSGANFFPTPPWGARAGAELIKRLDPAARTAWEPACGAMHMAHGLGDYFETVHASDAYLYDGNAIHDFLTPGPAPVEADWIVTNPPFGPAEAFVRRAWPLARRGVAMLMRAGMMESAGRHALLYRDCPLTVFAPFQDRLPMLEGRYEDDGSSAAFYAWFLFLKPVLRPRRFMARLPGPDGAMMFRPGVLEIAPGTRQRLFRRSDLRFAVRRAHGADKAGPTPSGDAITDGDIDLISAVAAGGAAGVTPLTNVFPRARMASLAMFGLLARTDPDRLGERRFVVSDAGREMLIDLGRAG